MDNAGRNPDKNTVKTRKVLERLASLGGSCQTLDELFVNIKCSNSQRRHICDQLGQAGQLDFHTEITQFGLTIAAKTLLKLDTSVWPVTPDELLVLRSCAGGRITPRQIHSRVPVDQRQRLLQSLDRKGLIMTYQTDIVDITLRSQAPQRE